MRKLALLAVFSVAAIGCASSKGEMRADEAATQEQAVSAPPAAMCPMAVEGAAVRAEETQDGAALVFTTTGGDVGELRKRVGGMAERHAKMQEAGGGCPCMQGMGHGPHGGPHGGGMQGGGMQGGGMQGGGMGPHGGMTPEMQAGMMAMKNAKVKMEEVEGGARLVFTPADPAQLPALRQAVQTRAGMMASGQCPMMKKGAPSAPPSAG